MECNRRIYCGELLCGNKALEDCSGTMDLVPSSEDSHPRICHGRVQNLSPKYVQQLDDSCTRNENAVESIFTFF